MLWMITALIVAQTDALTPFPSGPVERPPVPEERLPAIAEHEPSVPDSIAFPPLRRIESDRWFGADKLWHLGASFAVVGAGYHLLANRLSSQHGIELTEPVPTVGAMGGAFALGLVKEFTDLNGPNRHFSWKDLAFDALGIAAGYAAFIHEWRN